MAKPKLVPTTPPKTAAKTKKPVVIPNSIKYAMEKSKARLIFAIPGRYILKTRKATFAIVRVAQEMKATPGITTKMFAATASNLDINIDDLFGEFFESDSATAQPGAKSNVADQKLGKKTHAKGVLAKGWWIFKKGADGKVSRAYVGGRISGRRVLGLIDPSQSAKPATEVKDQISDAAKAKIKTLTAQAKKLTEGIAKAKERLTTLKKATSKIALKGKIAEAVEAKRKIVSEIAELKGKKPAAPKADSKPKAEPKTPAAPKGSDVKLTPALQKKYDALAADGKKITAQIKMAKEKLTTLKRPSAVEKVKEIMATLRKAQKAIAEKMVALKQKVRDRQAKPKATPEAKPAAPKADPKPKAEPKPKVDPKPAAPKADSKPKGPSVNKEKVAATKELKKLDKEMDADVERIDALKEQMANTKDPKRRMLMQKQVEALDKRIELKARKASGVNSVVKSGKPQKK